MKKFKYIYILMAACTALWASCSKDNLKPPTETLTGRVMAAGEPVSVRSTAVSFELWQHGYGNFTKIPLAIAADGTFSALLYKGDYKLTRPKGAGPWADQTDSIDVHIDGDKSLDVTVDPYFVIRNVGFQKGTGTVTATFTIQAVNTTKTLELAKFYLGANVLVDDKFNSLAIQVPNPINITGPVTITATIPASLVNQDYIFARVGVKTTGIAELMYSQSQKVQLK